MPETLFEAEEIARTVDSISRRVNQPSNDANLEKLVKSLVLQNAELTASLDKLNSSTAPTVKASSPAVNVSSLDGPPAVAVFNDSLRGNTGTDALRNEIRKLGEMFQKLSREIDARFRGIVRRIQTPQAEQTRERTRDGRPTCFSCGRIGHLQASCPERRNLGYRTQIQPQQRTERPSYSENPRYNQQNRRDQGVAALDENWSDDELFAPFGQRRSEQGYSDSDPEHRLASTQQKNVEILSNDTVMFSRQQSQNALNLNHGLTPPRPPSLPSNDAIVRSQSFPGQSKVQPPVPGISCFGPGSACAQVTPNNTPATQPTQLQANVDVNLSLEPILRAVEELKANETQTPIPESSSTRPVSDIGKNVVDVVPENSLTSAQSFNDPSGILVNSQPSATQSYHDLGLASRTDIPLGPVLQGGDACTKTRPIKKYVNRPSNSRQDIPVPPRDARSSRHLPSVQAQPKDSTKLPDPVGETTGTVTQANESQERKVKRKVRNSSPQSQPGHVPEKQDSDNENGIHRKTMIPVFPEKSSSALKTTDLTIVGDLDGQSVELLVDTGACVSAIDEQLVKKIYGSQPASMTDGFVPSVKTVNGERVPVLGMIEVPVKLAGTLYQGQFHIMPSLTHEVILGRDFLQKHRAVLDLEKGSLTLTDRPLKLSTTSTSRNNRVMGTFVFSPSKTSTLAKDTSCNVYKKSDIQISSGKEEYRKTTHHFPFQWSFWIFLLVAFYLFMTSRAHILDELQLTEREKKGNSYNATQNQAKTQETASVTLLDHHSKCFIKTFAHNWHHPYIRGGCTPYFAHVKVNSQSIDGEGNECDALLLRT